MERGSRPSDARPGRRGLAGKIGLAVAATILGLVAVLGLATLLIPPSGPDVRSIEDRHRVGQILKVAREAASLPATADGRVDVYRVLFGPLELHEDNVQLLHHSREGRGPTVAQVRAGDYRHYVWERARVADLGDDPAAPLLWDPRPFDGKRIVGFRNGTVRRLEDAEFAALSDAR